MRARLMLLLAVLLAMTMVAAGPAGGAPPNCETLPEDHPRYCGPPPSTTTTAVPDDSIAGTVCGPVPAELNLEWLPVTEELEGLADTGGFRFTLTGRSDFDSACIDVETYAPLQWIATVEGSGARHLGLVPRDSIAPGDTCGAVTERHAAIYGTHTLGHEGFIPATTINGCDVYHPDSSYGEWVDPALVPAEECAAIDPDLGCKVIGARPETHPFAFHAFMQSAAEQTTITVEFSPLEP